MSDVEIVMVGVRENALEDMDYAIRDELLASLPDASAQVFVDAYAEQHEETFGEIWEIDE